MKSITQGQFPSSGLGRSISDQQPPPPLRRSAIRLARKIENHYVGSRLAVIIFLHDRPSHLSVIQAQINDISSETHVYLDARPHRKHGGPSQRVWENK